MFHRIDTAIAEQMLREGAITIKGKGGKVRTVPVNEQITSAMKKCLDITERGHKLLGHERADVTNIYLASTNGGKKQA